MERPRITDDMLEQINYEQDFRRARLLGKYEPDYTIEEMLEIPSYEIADTFMKINDPVWGEAVIGEGKYDQLLVNLARTPAFRRLQSIEQLSLNEHYATMPNSMYFSRWQHIWGSVAFVRKMVENDDRFDERQKMVLQLRTLLSDVGHTAFSHLGDWIFEGVGKTEDLHDQDLLEYLRLTGIEDELSEFGFSLEETVFPEVEDWVECPSPNLCVDRVDYGLREMLRWVHPSIPFSEYHEKLRNPQSLFEIDDDGMLVITDQKFARYFAAGFSLLPTEHWSHPVHRLELQFLQQGVQSAIAEECEVDSMHPRESLFAIDSSFYPHFQTWDMTHLNRTMVEIARNQREIFAKARRNDLNLIFAGIREPDWEFPDFPDPLQPYTWQSREYGLPYPASLHIKQVEGSDQMVMTSAPDGLHVTLPALKPRSVDPLVKTLIGSQPFSTLEPSYAAYLQGQRKQMQQAFEAIVLMRQDIADKFVNRHKNVMQNWSELVKRKRSAEKLQTIVRDVMPFAAIRRFDNIYEVDDADIEPNHDR